MLHSFNFCDIISQGNKKARSETRKMANIKVLKEPGFLYDLNYLFYSKFNTQVCIDAVADEFKRDDYAKYLNEIHQHFGDISEDLYIFYHAIGNGRCFITTYYFDPYKEKFVTGFNFKRFKELISDTPQLMQNIIRFYLHEFPKEKIEECIVSNAKLFACIKESKYSGDEKSKLYEFFLNPAPHLQALQYELIEKDILLSSYYKEKYEIILEAHNNSTFENIYENVKDIDNLDFLNDPNQVLYPSTCLLNKYHMHLFFVEKGAVYLLGYDYRSILNAIFKAQKHPLNEMCSALGDENRLRMLDFILERGAVTCKDLEKNFDFSGSTAYHHITLLTRAGALKTRNEKKTIYYSVNKKYFDTIQNHLKKYSNN